MCNNMVRVYLADRINNRIYETGLAVNLSMEENECLLQKIIPLPNDAVFVIHEDGYVIGSDEVIEQIKLKDGEVIDVY